MHDWGTIGYIGVKISLPREHEERVQLAIVPYLVASVVVHGHSLSIRTTMYIIYIYICTKMFRQSILLASLGSNKGNKHICDNNCYPNQSNHRFARVTQLIVSDRIERHGHSNNNREMKSQSKDFEWTLPFLGDEDNHTDVHNSIKCTLTGLWCPVWLYILIKTYNRVHKFDSSSAMVHGYWSVRQVGQVVLSSTFPWPRCSSP